uniref:Uncharacterized protein n=2 Tax=Lygus hesperus TaxID=30085 RepID=A0A146M3Q4_LYGHE
MPFKHQHQEQQVPTFNGAHTRSRYAGQVKLNEAYDDVSTLIRTPDTDVISLESDGRDAGCAQNTLVSQQYAPYKTKPVPYMTRARDNSFDIEKLGTTFHPANAAHLPTNGVKHYTPNQLQAMSGTGMGGATGMMVNGMGMDTTNTSVHMNTVSPVPNMPMQQWCPSEQV